MNRAWSKAGCWHRLMLLAFQCHSHPRIHRLDLACRWSTPGSEKQAGDLQKLPPPSVFTQWAGNHPRGLLYNE